MHRYSVKRMVTLLVYLRRRRGLTRDQFRRYWRDVHGPLVISVTEFMQHLRCYVQYDPVEVNVPDFPVTQIDVDGIAVVSFDHCCPN